MSAALDTKGPVKVKEAGWNAYTALLGLAVLILAATAGLVCYLGQTQYGEIFKIVRP